MPFANAKMNVPEFDRIAREIFAPAYYSIAEQIKEATAVTEGMCLDVGAGGGYLGIALARITNLHAFLLDKSPEMLHIAATNVKAAGLSRRVHALLGDVHNIPLGDKAVNLVISRGSLFFWEDKIGAFREIYRVLIPGGRAYVGGGLGAPHIRKAIMTKMKEMDKSWPHCSRTNDGDKSEEYREALRKADVERYSVTRSDAGTWIEIWK